MRAYVLFSLALFVGHSAVAKTCQVSRDVSGPFKHEWVSYTDDVRQNNQVLLIGTQEAERERQVENEAQSLIKMSGNESQIIELLERNKDLIAERNLQADAIRSLLAGQHAPRMIAIDPILRKNENIQSVDPRFRDLASKPETFQQSQMRAQELQLAIGIRMRRDLSIESARKLLVLAIGPLMKVAVDRPDLFNNVEVGAIDTEALDKMASSNTLPSDAWSERIYITAAKNLDSLTLTVNTICQKAANNAPKTASTPAPKVVPVPVPAAPAPTTMASPTGPAATPTAPVAVARPAAPAPVLRPIVTQFRPRRSYARRSHLNRYVRATRASTYLSCPRSPFTTCRISGGYVHIRPVQEWGRYRSRHHYRRY